MGRDPVIYLHRYKSEIQRDWKGQAKSFQRVAMTDGRMALHYYLGKRHSVDENARLGRRLLIAAGMQSPKRVRRRTRIPIGARPRAQ